MERESIANMNDKEKWSNVKCCEINQKTHKFLQTSNIMKLIVWEWCECESNNKDILLERDNMKKNGDREQGCINETVKGSELVQLC